MNIIDPDNLLSKDERSALLYYLSLPFPFGGYPSLLSMAEALKLKVIVKGGIKNMPVPDELFEARCYWEARAAQLLPQIKPGTYHRRRSKTLLNYLHATHQAKYIQDEMQLWTELPLLGRYDTTHNSIVLYAETMRDEDRQRTLRAIVPYSSGCDEAMKNAAYRSSFTEILLTTAVRALWHTYFYQSEETTQHYYPLIEAPLIEYALLIYLKHTGSPFIHWACEDVKRMPTCHRHGIALMHQYASANSRSRIINFISSYRKNICKAQSTLIYDVYAGCNLKELVE